MKTKQAAYQIPAALASIISRSQLSAVRQCLRGEEKEFFESKMSELAQTFATMPQPYQQDGKGDNAVVYLHFFKGGADWFITERDSSPEQLQAFGLADIGYGGELGYISIDELIANGVELDFHFAPTTVGEIKAKRA